MSDFDDFFALNDKDVKNWIAKDEGVGGRCQGTVVAREEWESTYDGGPVPVVLVAPRDGAEYLWRVVGYDTVLRNELGRQDPKPGDLIDVRYTGTAEGARGEYASYRVLVRKVVPESSSDLADDKVQEVRDIAERWAENHPADGDPF